MEKGRKPPCQLTGASDKWAATWSCNMENTLWEQKGKRTITHWLLRKFLPDFQRTICISKQKWPCPLRHLKENICYVQPSWYNDIISACVKKNGVAQFSHTELQTVIKYFFIIRHMHAYPHTPLPLNIFFSLKNTRGHVLNMTDIKNAQFSSSF